MRPQIAAIVVALLMEVASANGQVPSGIERLAWLQGCWETTAGVRTVEEQWMSPRGGNMIGMGRTLRDGHLAEYELVVLREQGDQLAYEAHPSEQPSAVFLSRLVSDSMVVFENPKHDFPQTIGYQRQGSDSVLAWIEGTSAGKSRRVEFPYVRTACRAQGATPTDEPAVTFRGQTYTPRSILSRNMGTEEDQTTAFPPHKVIGNIYYVGTRTLSSFLITTREGHILINSTYERNVRTIEKSVTQLGFKFEDIRVLLGTHAHGDHQEGDALIKQLTGAQVVVMQEDVPALEAIRPGGKAHPIDRLLRDGDKVTLGDTSLVAHLTAGHTRGCTTWTMTTQEGGRTFNVVFACSYRAPGNVTPEIEGEFNRTFRILRSLPCDVPLGDHPAQYNMAAKYARLNKSGSNPFIDAANCWTEAELQEAMLRAQMEMQQKGRQ